MIQKSIIFGCLFLGFLLLFRRIRWLDKIRQLMKQTKESMDEAARQRMLQSRRTLLSMQEEKSILMGIERELQYSGLKRRFPFLTAERWIVTNLAAMAILFCLLQWILPKWWMVMLAVMGIVVIEILYIAVAKLSAMRSVERNLLKVLDFLGNYSVTAGEITGIFNQVSRYMEEPLKSALDECYYEAQTTGDASMALLSMAEKIEHPQFKELIKNIEISIRYSADFTALVHGSRRTVREYLRAGGERKNMLREAAINILLLLSLSGFILLTVNGLIEVSIWHILFFTIPGKISIGILLVVFVLFARQLYKISR